MLVGIERHAAGRHEPAVLRVDDHARAGRLAEEGDADVVVPEQGAAGREEREEREREASAQDAKAGAAASGEKKRKPEAAEGKPREAKPSEGKPTNGNGNGNGHGNGGKEAASKEKSDGTVQRAVKRERSEPTVGAAPAATAERGERAKTDPPETAEPGSGPSPTTN